MKEWIIKLKTNKTATIDGKPADKYMQNMSLCQTMDRLIAEIEQMEKKTEKLQYLCDCTEEVLDLISENPYCKEIFPEPTKEQYALFHSILQKHGLTLDRFSGAVSRKAWDGFKALVNNKLQQAIKKAKK